MIDIIGMVLGTGFLFAIATAVAIILAALTWFTLRSKRRRIRWTLFAIALPFATAVLWWFSAALLPGESLFGNIDEPLPNGYRIEAFGKMPEYGSISNPSRPFANIGMADSVGKVAVEGPLVIGQYSRAFGSPDATSTLPFFIFDTSADHTTEFPTLQALQVALGHTVNLEELPFFHSPLAATRRAINNTIAFGPPIAGLLLLLYVIVTARRYSQPSFR